jgi:hypothetical protein
VANHMKMKLNGGRRLCEHNFDLQNLKVVKVAITNQKKLDAYESILLYKKSQEKTDEQRTTNSWQYYISSFQTFGLIFDQSNRDFFNHLNFFSSISSRYIRV